MKNASLKIKLIVRFALIVLTIPLLAGQCAPAPVEDVILKLEIRGSGSVKADNNQLDCSKDCNESFRHNSTVTLTAKAATAYSFVKWSGDCAGLSNVCSLQMNADKTVSAIFAPSKIVSVPDANLAKMIRAKLGLAANKDITEANMLRINSLDSKHSLATPEIDKIVNLQGLQYAKNLKSLRLSYNKLNNISYLRNLSALSVLDLGRNRITSVSALKRLINLKELGLYDNRLSGIADLKDLTKLQRLYLNNTKISDLSALKNLDGLEVLYLRFNQIGDISVVKNLPNLRELYLQDNKIRDISSLRLLTGLQSLDISENKVDDITALVENSGLIGGKDSIDMTNNCLDTGSSKTKLNIQKLIQRGVRLKYEPQKTSGCS